MTRTMMTGAALAAILVVAGCGVDGPPVPPAGRTEPAPQTGLQVTGQVEMGVTGRP
ncbi:hypothetical protein [Frigidibacter oleivorans]|uniref:hypothetical protein n=1 Tax=Frigidibacter oleivorans TaxID=2487129 RepID=UPI0013E02190|nr:hypothetical protein [Frigidibacter oleivorans]